MNIDRLWNKYATLYKNILLNSDTLMTKKSFTEAIGEIISLPVEPPVMVNFAEFKMAVSLLRDLADLQNGAPLVTYEKEWQRTMDNIYAFLNEYESKISA